MAVLKILNHVVIPSVAPAPWPARGPPEIADLNQESFEFYQQSPDEI